MTQQATGQTVELELTFLARYLPKEIEGATGKELRDAYVPDTGVEHPCLRVRKRGDRYEITKKYPINDNDASVQQETTIPLTLEEFEALSCASTKRIAKVRYNVTIGGYPAEVDVFQYELAGLVLIDFEFTTEDEKSRFVPPAVCLADVTQTAFIAGGLLAGKSYADIAPELRKLGYEPIAPTS